MGTLSDSPLAELISHTTAMKPVRILVDSLADAGLPNAQMGNAREIICRLDPDRFHVSTFTLGDPDPRILARKNTRLIQLPKRRQTVRIFSEFLLGSHELLFYMKVAPASRWYSGLRKKWHDRRITIGTIESQCNFDNQPCVPPGLIESWEQTVLRCDRLYSNSASVQQSLLNEYGLTSEVIPTGADTSFFSPDWNRPPNSRPQVLFVASLRVSKQPQFILSAAAQFREADFRLAGEGPMAEELAARVSREGLTNVTLTGPLRARQLRDEYRRADIFLFPSNFEGSPKVIVEAAACGLPVIARNTYKPETVIHGITGFQAANDEEIFEFLALLLGNPALRQQFGRAARVHSLKYDWDPITAMWEKAFSELAIDRELRSVS